METIIVRGLYRIETIPNTIWEKSKVGDLTHCVGHYDETEEETLTHPWVCAELHRNETGRPDLIDRNKWSYDKCMQGGFIK